ncbi:MAG: hypothetical protein J3K34DRAFT_426559 [Monoraphidium minutum]|nr:MAG: hypothetical protein J3K34DRAFT_426559 [Monoraphidium minutum]
MRPLRLAAEAPEAACWRTWHPCSPSPLRAGRCTCSAGFAVQRCRAARAAARRLRSRCAAAARGFGREVKGFGAQRSPGKGGAIASIFDSCVESAACGSQGSAWAPCRASSPQEERMQGSRNSMAACLRPMVLGQSGAPTRAYCWPGVHYLNARPAGCIRQ